jgi:hypothetical protein
LGKLGDPTETDTRAYREHKVQRLCRQGAAETPITCVTEERLAIP